MSIHATIQIQNPNTGEVYNVKEFKEYGSQKSGNTAIIGPVEDAQQHVQDNLSLMTEDGISILIIDSQAPGWSADHKKRIHPEYESEVSNRIVWD